MTEEVLTETTKLELRLQNENGRCGTTNGLSNPHYSKLQLNLLNSTLTASKQSKCHLVIFLNVNVRAIHITESFNWI